MTLRDRLLALLVVVIWGVNFVVIKFGLQGMPPFLLAGMRFLLVALPAIFFIPRPTIPWKWLLLYGMTMSFAQFAFLFVAIKVGMPAGLASLVLQAQVFFTLLLGVVLMGESCASTILSASLSPAAACWCLCRPACISRAAAPPGGPAADAGGGVFPGRWAT